MLDLANQVTAIGHLGNEWERMCESLSLYKESRVLALVACCGVVQTVLARAVSGCQRNYLDGAGFVVVVVWASP